MEELTKSEERIMQIIWKLQEAFVKDIIAEMQNPDIPYNTVSSVVRILEKKGFVGYKAYGKTHQYYPLISRKDYKKFAFKQLISNYFDHSYQNLVSFIVKNENVDAEELEEIKRLLNDK